VTLTPHKPSIDHGPGRATDRSLRWIALLVLVLGVASPLHAQVSTDSPRVRFTTTLGAFTVQLDSARAPLTVASFLQYVRDGHYDGTIFHRVINNFIVQGGGFLPDGTEKPTRPGVPNESGNGLSNRRGSIAMARTDDPHSATAQFYVNITDNISLDPGPTRWGYAVFGRVVDGMDVIDRISTVATGSQGKFSEDAPIKPIVIESARVETGAATAP
jgi:cyclophilin family peptidyl-prolyl cis-trans isomerase